jgi:hypothetical protein
MQLAVLSFLALAVYGVACRDMDRDTYRYTGRDKQTLTDAHSETETRKHTLSHNYQIPRRDKHGMKKRGAILTCDFKVLDP